MKNIMKKLIVSAMALAFVFSLTAYAGSKSQPQQVVGGWTEEADEGITEELQTLFDKAMEGRLGVNYTPVKLLETQLVSGTNYRFLCDSQVVAPGAEVKQSIVTIYQSLDGRVEVLEITEAE